MGSPWMDAQCEVVCILWGYCKRARSVQQEKLSLWEWPLPAQTFGGSVLSAGFHSCLDPAFLHRACGHLSISRAVPRDGFWIPGCPWKPLPPSHPISANCRTCHHNHSEAFLVLEPPQLSSQLRCCLISSAVTINIYKPSIKQHLCVPERPAGAPVPSHAPEISLEPAGGDPRRGRSWGCFPGEPQLWIPPSFISYQSTSSSSFRAKLQANFFFFPFSLESFITALCIYYRALLSCDLGFGGFSTL